MVSARVITLGEFDFDETHKKVALMSCLLKSLSSLSRPTVAPKMPRDTLVPFWGVPSLVLILEIWELASSFADEEGRLLTILILHRRRL